MLDKTGSPVLSTLYIDTVLDIIQYSPISGQRYINGGLMVVPFLNENE